MADLVRPFAALRPTASSAAEVVAPPYDVVSTEEARALAKGRPRSFLHISRPEIDLPEGSSAYSDEAYAQGARNLERLVAERVLVREDKPTITSTAWSCTATRKREWRSSAPCAPTSRTASAATSSRGP